MKNNKILLSSLLLMLVFLFSCTQKRTYRTDEEVAQFKEPLIKINKYLVKKDAEHIADYVKRRKWKMEVSKTGLWYMIYEKGSGSKSKIGQVALLNYKIFLLDGTLCYSSDSLGAKTFAIGHGGVESGLEEGILLMHQGDKARLIMPPYRAHGLLGDMNKIPARSIIVYEIELLKLSKGSF